MSKDGLFPLLLIWLYFVTYIPWSTDPRLTLSLLLFGALSVKFSVKKVIKQEKNISLPCYQIVRSFDWKRWQWLRGHLKQGVLWTNNTRVGEQVPLVLLLEGLFRHAKYGFLSKSIVSGTIKSLRVWCQNTS